MNGTVVSLLRKEMTKTLRPFFHSFSRTPDSADPLTPCHIKWPSHQRFPRKQHQPADSTILPGFSSFHRTHCGLLLLLVGWYSRTGRCNKPQINNQTWRWGSGSSLLLQRKPETRDLLQHRHASFVTLFLFPIVSFNASAPDMVLEPRHGWMQRRETASSIECKQWTWRAVKTRDAINIISKQLQELEMVRVRHEDTYR